MDELEADPRYTKDGITKANGDFKGSSIHNETFSSQDEMVVHETSPIPIDIHNLLSQFISSNGKSPRISAHYTPASPSDTKAIK